MLWRFVGEVLCCASDVCAVALSAAFEFRHFPLHLAESDDRDGLRHTGRLQRLLPPDGARPAGAGGVSGGLRALPAVPRLLPAVRADVRPGEGAERRFPVRSAERAAVSEAVPGARTARGVLARRPAELQERKPRAQAEGVLPKPDDLRGDAAAREPQTGGQNARRRAVPNARLDRRRPSTQQNMSVGIAVRSQKPVVRIKHY